MISFCFYHIFFPLQFGLSSHYFSKIFSWIIYKMFSFYQPSKKENSLNHKISWKYCFEYSPQRLLNSILVIIVFWINSFCFLDFLSSSIVDSARIFKFPCSWFILICFGCCFIFHFILAKELNMYHFWSFWTSWDNVWGLVRDTWNQMGSGCGQLEIIHSTSYPLILS